MILTILTSQQKINRLVWCQVRVLLLRGTFYLLVGTSCLQAQIVNIEDKRRKLDSVGWAGQIDLSAQLTQNTRNITTLSGAFRLDRQTKKGIYLVLGNYNLVRADEERFINDGFGHLRYGYRLNTRWTWEVFGQLQYNRRLNIGLRGLVGTGPRVYVTKTDKLDLTLGLLYMYEYNELTEGAIVRRDQRLNTYLSLRYRPKPYLTLNSTSYYQPLLATFGKNGRASTINTLVLTLSERLKLTSSFSLVYDGLLASLVESVPRVTYQWRNGLRFQF